MVNAEDILADILASKPVKYDNETIEGELDLSKLTPLKDDEGRVHIPVSIEIKNSEVLGKAKFRDVVFEEPVSFKNTNFGGIADLVGARFDSNAEFCDAVFSSRANFTNAQFDGSADFSKVEFSGGDAYFGEARFISHADFHRAQFGGNAHFGEAHFCGDVSFSWANFIGDAHFPKAEFHETLDLNKSKFNVLYISWNLIKDRVHYYGNSCKDVHDNGRIDGPTYLALIKNFKIVEQFGDADECFYQYRKESQDCKRLYGDWDWSKLSDIASWISCGYGVRPIHTVICMFCIVVIGWVFFIGSSESLFESFYFSVMTFTGGDPDNLTIGRWLRTVAMIEAILGYLLMALFVVVLGRKFIR